MPATSLAMSSTALGCIPVPMIPVFMVSGDADPVGDYGKGVRRAYDSLVAAGLTDIRYVNPHMGSAI